MTVTDSFTDTNGTNLTAHTAVITWGKQTTGQPQIQSNQLQPKASAADQWCYDSTHTYNNDQTAQITLVVKTDTNDVSLAGAVRMATGAETGYTGYLNATSYKAQLYKVSAGTFTQLGSDAAAALVANDQLQTSAVGTSITLNKNGSAIVGPITDSAIASGVAGIYGFGTSTTQAVDDWTATGEISSGTGDGLSHGLLRALTGITF